MTQLPMFESTGYSLVQPGIVQHGSRVVFLESRGWTQYECCPDYWQKDGGPLKTLNEAYWQECEE